MGLACNLCSSYHGMDVKCKQDCGSQLAVCGRSPIVDVCLHRAW